jgi:hypothetical protein
MLKDGNMQINAGEETMWDLLFKIAYNKILLKQGAIRWDEFVKWLRKTEQTIGTRLENVLTRGEKLKPELEMIRRVGYPRSMHQRQVIEELSHEIPQVRQFLFKE